MADLHADQQALPSFLVTNEEHSTENTRDSSVEYGLSDVPPWYLCVLLAFQNFLILFGGNIVVPIVISQAICAGEDYEVQSKLTGTIFFAYGLVTFLQTTFGNRLPIVQGGSFSYLPPAIALLNLEQWKCPITKSSSYLSHFNDSIFSNNTMSTKLTNATVHPEIWQSRLRELQGAVMVACCLEVLVGFSGLVGILIRFIGPLTIAPTISLIGLSLFENVARFSSGHWWISLMQIESLLSVIGHVVQPNLWRIFLGICISWLICYILTITEVLPQEGWGSAARTDAKSEALYQTHWFRFPYPGQWGMPTVSVAGVFGMAAGCIATTIESVGDYYACAKLAGAPPPPTHAINRGICFEGLGSVLAAAWGTGNGTTSYSTNIGAIAITKVASRRVIQVTAIIMMIFGIIGKFGAIFVTMPDPIFGAILMAAFGMIVAVGLANLQYVQLNSARNLFILGFSIMFGMSVPQWLRKNPDVIKSGNEIVDQIFTVLFSTGMLVGGMLALLLDNTIPGSREERGMDAWRSHELFGDILSRNDVFKKYDLPIGMRRLRKWKWTKYIPICPTFRGYRH